MKCKIQINRMRHRRERGNNLVEFALVAPIAFLILISVFDAGFYVYSFISVQSAVRAAATRNSGGRESAVDQTSACKAAIQHLAGLPSIAGLSGSCASAPLQVSSVLCDGPSSCGRAATSADGTPAALVTVSYTLPSMFSLPIAKATVVSISSQMKLRDVE